MALSRPALEVLGISPSFARNHSESVVVAVAESIYRAAMSKYHPDRGEESIPVPKGVNLTDLQEARDLVRQKPGACIRELGRGERISREAKRVAELEAEIAELQNGEDAQIRNLTMLWEYIAHQKLDIDTGGILMKDSNRASYSVHNFNGLGILVVPDDERHQVLEYLCHHGIWFRRSLVKVRFSKTNPCPPSIPQELISTQISDDRRGSFYDQASPHEMLEKFAILGSYTKTALATERRKKPKDEESGGDEARKPTIPFAGIAITGGGGLELEPAVINVLRPNATVGSVLQAVALVGEEQIQYTTPGVISGIRVFDPKQRP